jgi:hypothetical protein
MLHETRALTVEKLWSFQDLSQSLGMFSATINAAKSNQNLPKSAQRQLG